MGDTIIMTETDRELLMFAAKAAGIECGIIHGEIRIRCDSGWTPWNPLYDDGDALRLAVKLNIAINFGIHASTINVDVYDWANEVEVVGIKEDGCKDAYAATRRAIVRAAAEIGRNMK